MCILFQQVFSSSVCFLNIGVISAVRCVFFIYYLLWYLLFLFSVFFSKLFLVSLLTGNFLHDDQDMQVLKQYVSSHWSTARGAFVTVGVKPEAVPTLLRYVAYNHEFHRTPC